MSELKIIPLFPTPIAITHIGLEENEKQFLLSEKNIPMWKEIPMTNYRSENSTILNSFDDNKYIKNIKSKCEFQIKRYLEEIEGIDTDRAELRITQSWLNKTKPRETHHQHVHPNSYLSGVFYVQCLAPNDYIIFENKDNRAKGNCCSLEFPIKNINQYNNPLAIISVKEGDLILFPSWMMHHVEENMTENEERTSLSFNTFPIGELGEERFLNHIKL